MKRSYSIVAAIALIGIMAFALTGCQTDLTQKTTQARDAYTGVIMGLNQAEISGQITQTQLISMRPYRAAAQSALDAMQAFATTDAASWDKAFAEFNSAISELNAAKATATAATQPSS